jgi:hypothetical protein
MNIAVHPCYVVTDQLRAEVQMPSIVADLHKAHLARLARFKTAAVGEKAKAAAAVIEKPPVETIEPRTSWVERQKVIPLPRPRWFGIVEEIDPAPPEPRPLLVEDIQRVACKYFSVQRNDMLSPRRDVRVAYPRHIVMYLAKTLTMKSLPEIGRRLGGRDHTTILHGVRKIERLVRTDWEVAYDVAHVEALL